MTQARMTSQRLPGKVLLPLGAFSVLSAHLNRLLKSEHTVILALADSEQDQELWQWAEQNEFPYVVGSTKDVLSRFMLAAKKFDLDVIVRVTSDCPLVDGVLIGVAVGEYLKWDDERGYLANGVKPSYPRGFDFEIFSRSLLEKADFEAKESFQREHVTPYIKEIANIRGFSRDEDASRFRITIDEPSDYELIQKLVSEYGALDLSAEEIIQVMEKEPHLAAINSHVEQKKLNQ